MNDITISKKELVEVIGEKDLGEVIKPLIEEIHLFDTFVAGTSRLKDAGVLETVQTGDKVTLRREQNKFDENAILVLDADKRKLGYVPEKDDLIFSRLMDAGKLLIGKVTSVEREGGLTKIRMGIYLVDY